MGNGFQRPGHRVSEGKTRILASSQKACPAAVERISYAAWSSGDLTPREHWQSLCMKKVTIIRLILEYIIISSLLTMTGESVTNSSLFSSCSGLTPSRLALPCPGADPSKTRPAAAAPFGPLLPAKKFVDLPLKRVRVRHHASYECWRKDKRIDVAVQMRYDKEH